jgi:hypothetical protein
MEGLEQTSPTNTIFFKSNINALLEKLNAKNKDK